MFNPVAPLAIIEQVALYCGLRWRFRLEDEEGTTRHTGEPRVLKSEADADRSAMVRRANNWRRRVNDGYADPDAADAALLRVALRAVYDTRDKAKAPGG